MQFLKSNVVLVLLVFSFIHVRSAPQDYDDPIVDESIDGADGIQDTDDAAVEGKDCPDALHDDVISGDDHNDYSVEKLDGKKKLDLSTSAAKDVVPAQCKQGSYFYTDGCNICYCYKEGTLGCTDVFCEKNSETKLLSKPANSQVYKKLRDNATGCVPGEKIEVQGCVCNCVIPSVMTCEKSCGKL